LTTNLGASPRRTDATGAAAAPDLPALTSLRGIAAVTVLFFHASWIAYNYAGGAPPAFWRRGYLAVDLFFLLSGFILTHVYRSRLAAERSWPAIGQFLWARFCRIYPASLFTTALFVLVYTVGGLYFQDKISFTAQLIAALLLLQVPWLDTIAINPPSWSISAEWYAYLLFPFFVPLIWRLRGRTAAMAGIVLVAAVSVDHTIFGHEDQSSGWGALIRALPEFTIGVFAYRYFSEKRSRKFWEKDATLIGIGAMIFAACSAGISDGVIVVLLLALLLASVCNSGRVAPILTAAPLRWLGEVSYSIYISQLVPFLLMTSISGILVSHGLGGSTFEAIFASLGIGSGVLVHRCIDVPARTRLRQLPDRLAASVIAYRARRGSEAGSISVG